MQWVKKMKVHEKKDLLGICVQDFLITEPILRIPNYDKNQSLAPASTIQCRKLKCLMSKVPSNYKTCTRKKNFGNLRKKTKHTTSYSELMRTERKRTQQLLKTQTVDTLLGSKEKKMSNQSYQRALANSAKFFRKQKKLPEKQPSCQYAIRIGTFFCHGSLSFIILNSNLKILKQVEYESARRMNTCFG